MTDDSDSDARPSLDDEDEEMSSISEESPDDDDLADEDEQDEDEMDEGEDEDGDGSNDNSAEEDESENGSSKETSKKEDSKPAHDVTTVALERTIFVGNLPSKLDHRDVAKLFKPCGPVESARIRSVVPEKEKLSPKVALITKRLHPKVDSVNAYVVFAKTDNDDCIKKALAMNGTVIDDHHIRVDRAQQPNSRRLTLTSRKKSVFVGNLRFDLRDDDLINHFSKVGSVDYIRLVRDRATGLGKGFGFVKFMERAAVKKALELNDTDFKGRKLRVKKVDEKMKMNDDDKKTPQRSRKNIPADDDEQQEKVQQGGPAVKSGFNRRRQTDGPKQFDRPRQSGQSKQFDRTKQFGGSKQSERSKQFVQSRQGKFGDRRPNQDFKRNSHHGYPNDNKKRVKFDLKGTRGPRNQQRREGPQFNKVKITKNVKKVKKNTVLKKKVRKG